MFDDEKQKYFENINHNNKNTLARNIIVSPKSYYIQEIKKIISSYQDRFYDTDENNITFYIEYTNPNLIWSNSSSVTALEKNEISSSHEIVKINNKISSCHVYTEKISPNFVVPSGFGSYIVKDKVIESKVNSPSANANSQIKNYPFAFQLRHSLTATSDTARVFSARVRTSSVVKFEQKNDYQELVTAGTTGRGEWTETVPDGQTVTTGGNVSYTPWLPRTSESKDRLAVTSPFSCFAYTGDIGLGNVWDEYMSGKAGMSTTYIKYIQLTLNHAGHKTTVNGSFDATTVKNVKAFQTAKGLKEDGIVDSHTKEQLAFIWANKTADQLEATRVSVVDKNNYKDKDIWDFVNRSSNVYSASDGITAGVAIRMIGYTGSSRASEEIKMWLGVQMPNNPDIESMKYIDINPTSSFSQFAKDYKGIRVIDWNITAEYTPGVSVVQRTTAYHKSSNIKLDLSGIPCNGQWVNILIGGSSLGGSFGPRAAGIAIDSITCTYKMKDTITENTKTITHPAVPSLAPVYTTKNEVKIVEGVVEYDELFRSVSFGGAEKQITTGDLKNYGKLKSITIYEKVGARLTNNKISYSNLNLSLNDNSYTPDASRSEKIDISNPVGIVSLDAAAVVANTVTEQTSDIPALDSSVTVSKRSIGGLNRLDHFTSAASALINYDSTTSYVNSSVVSGYKLKRNGQIIDGKNTVNYYDGISLLCNSEGNPYGFDSLNMPSISNNISTVSDVYYSNIILTKTDGEQPGLQYGFYDVSTKEFLGKEITYLRYMKNPKEIFIGLFAYDYDGNINTQIEYTSSSVDQKYFPTQVPTKAAYPMFNVITKNRSKIQLKETTKNLRKTEIWPIIITSGSFNKAISITQTNPIGWKSKYKNQTLYAHYDTSSLSDIAWSKIHGRGYKDIVAEKPIYNSSQSIQLRQTPIHVVQTKSSDLTRKSSFIKPIVKVYFRDTITSPWQLCSQDFIKSINANTGLIQFKNISIPNNESLIKVDYTVKLKNIEIKQINGSPVELNPFLNKNTVKINKPIYVYIVPKSIYKEKDSVNTTKVLVKEYTESSYVKYTYNNNIFNKLDEHEYDPFAVLIGIIYVTNTNDDENFTFSDLRVKGGGISANLNTNKVIDTIPNAISYWDVYPAMAEAYPKGGHVIIKIPVDIKKNFINPQEVYDIIKQNLTAGVVFDLVDMDGNDWGSSAAISS
jgi:peptidoglycan hydrolase-like protein with peptidoglycan-binding domain